MTELNRKLRGMSDGALREYERRAKEQGMYREMYLARMHQTYRTIDFGTGEIE